MTHEARTERQLPESLDNELALPENSYLLMLNIIKVYISCQGESLTRTETNGGLIPEQGVCLLLSLVLPHK